MNSQVLGVLVASMAGGDEKDMQIGAWVAGNATQYNYLSHQELDAFEEQARNCKAQGNCDQVREEFRQLSVALDDGLNQLCGVSPQDCFAIHGDFIEQRVSLQERMAQLSLDSSIPWQLRADLHVYQLQNTNAVGTLVQAANQQSFEDIGLSSEQAELAAMLAATMAAGGLAGKASSSKSKPDFYINMSGEAIPATGYRYVSSEAPYLQDLLSHGTIPANNRGTNISFDNLNKGAADKLQVPHDAVIKIEFDTKQMLSDIQIPKGQWGKAGYLEPITNDFPQFGSGGATQAVTTQPIVVNKIIDTRTGKVLYERGQ